MKTAQKLKHPNIPNVQIDPELNKYQNIILFPEKLAKANKMLETANLPEYIRSSKPGK